MESLVTLAIVIMIGLIFWGTIRRVAKITENGAEVLLEGTEAGINVARGKTKLWDENNRAELSKEAKKVKKTESWDDIFAKLDGTSES